jgi:hypothetical protein
MVRFRAFYKKRSESSSLYLKVTAAPFCARPLLATCLGTDVLTPRAPSLPPAWALTFGTSRCWHQSLPICNCDEDDENGILARCPRIILSCWINKPLHCHGKDGRFFEFLFATHKLLHSRNCRVKNEGNQT